MTGHGGNIYAASRDTGIPADKIIDFSASINPLGTPKSVVAAIKKKLADVCKKIYDDPGFKKGIEKLGEEPKFGGPEFIKAAIKKQEEIGIPILKEIGLYVGK